MKAIGTFTGIEDWPERLAPVYEKTGWVLGGGGTLTTKIREILSGICKSAKQHGNCQCGGLRLVREGKVFTLYADPILAKQLMKGHNK